MESAYKTHEQRLEDHIQLDNDRFKAIGERLDGIVPDVSTIKGKLDILQWLILAVIGGIVAVYFHH